MKWIFSVSKLKNLKKIWQLNFYSLFQSETLNISWSGRGYVCSINYYGDLAGLQNSGFRLNIPLTHQSSFLVHRSPATSLLHHQQHPGDCGLGSLLHVGAAASLLQADMSFFKNETFHVSDGLGRVSQNGHLLTRITHYVISLLCTACS